MTLFEKEQSTGDISLNKIFNGKSLKCKDPGLSVKDIANLISTGGWPISLDLEMTATLQGVRNYLDEIKRKDMHRINNTKLNPGKIGFLLKSLARNIATTASLTTLASDTGDSGNTLNLDTVGDYLYVLSQLMIYEEQPAWAPHLRSKSRLRKFPKHHFVAPSLAVTVLRTSPDQLLKDINFLSLLFELLVIRDLRVFSQSIDGKVFHYRDNTGLEIYATVETATGNWGAFEIKPGTGPVEEAAETLLKFNDKIDTEKCGAPSVLGVIVEEGYAHV